jgi:hypothetical protein
MEAKMKKLVLVTISIICYLSSVAQPAQSQSDKAVTLGSVADITIGKDAVRLTTEELADHNRSLNKAETSLNPRFYKDIYKVGNTIVALVYGEGKPGTSLEEHKKILDQVRGKNTDPNKYSSTLSKVGNNQVLIISYTNDGLSYYRFFAVNASRNKGLNGILQVNQSEKNNAQGLMMKIINSIQFKTQ